MIINKAFSLLNELKKVKQDINVIKFFFVVEDYYFFRFMQFNF